MPPSVHLPPGAVFAGEFRVVRLLGEGGMGAVYAVEQWRTGHQRALKVMQPGLLHDQRMRARFLQEATVGARIRSEHVVHVVDAGIDAQTGTPWIAMELLEGADLAAVLGASGALSELDARAVFAQLCHAVDAAHEAGVVHRDLKPQNIFLAHSRREDVAFTVKVLDFGIAKLVAEAGAARAGKLGDMPSIGLGTPSWMAPEQADAKGRASPASDIWSLGLIAFALLTGRAFWRAIGGPDPGGIRLLREALIDPIAPASVRAAELGRARLLPPGFDAWFARCVARDPAARFARARDARVAFDGLLSHPEAPASRRAAPPRPPEPSRPPLVEHDTIPAPPAALRILLVDDSPSDRLLIGHHLIEAGYDVVDAASGEEALARVVADVPSLVLLDFLLPDIDAPEVLRRLRAIEAMAEVPVILLTGTDLAAHIAEGFQAGANDYLMKPVDPRRLVDRIRAALEAHDLVRRAERAAALEQRHGLLVADLEEAKAEQEGALTALPAAWNGCWAVGGVAQSGLVGGDLVAVFEGPRGVRTVAVIDVAGHGAAAALVGASARATLGVLLRTHGPADALAALNDELSAHPAARHVCLTLVRVAGREVSVVNAGLPPVVLVRRGQVSRTFASAGIPPGLFPEQTYAGESFVLMPGDLLAIVSDGLVEPFGIADEPVAVLTELGILDPARWTGTEKPADVAALLREKLADVPQPDDATLVLLGCTR